MTEIITVSEAIEKGLIRAEDVSLSDKERAEYTVADIDWSPVTKIIEVLAGMPYCEAEWVLEAAGDVIDRLKDNEKTTADPAAIRAALSQEICSVSRLPGAR